MFLEKVQQINILRNEIIQVAIQYVSNEIDAATKEIKDIVEFETLRNDENYQNIYSKLQNINFVSKTLGIEYCMPFSDYGDYNETLELSSLFDYNTKNINIANIVKLLYTMERKSKQWYGSLAQEC
jgi:hypothetical protein